MGNKLFVGNLPYSVGEAQLHELFARVGDVQAVHVMRDQFTGQGRGFAFVEMTSEDAALRATTDLHDTEIDGRRLVVNEARPKTSSPPSHGGRRDFGGPRRNRDPRW